MMAGVVSGNVVLVSLVSDILGGGARVLGFLEGGWAVGAISGGFVASQLSPVWRMTFYVTSVAVLSAGHFMVPWVSYVAGAVFVQMIFGFCRAMSGVVAQSSLMSIVPRHFMGRTQSAIAI